VGDVLTKLCALRPKSDPDVVRVLRLLLAQAEAGEIIGLAYVALKPGYEYSGDLLGYGLKHPVMALGLAKALEDKVSNLLR
jgi:hypothetical protein